MVKDPPSIYNVLNPSSYSDFSILDVSYIPSSLSRIKLSVPLFIPWLKETNSYLLSKEATDWSNNEFLRFKDFLTGGPMRTLSSEPSMVLLQDGGEIRENVLSDLPKEIWENFQEEFLENQ